MKLTVLCSLLALAGIADADESASRKAAHAAVSPLFERCIETANQPLFDFPISRKIGVSVNCECAPPKEKETDTRVFSYLLAMEPERR